jgi:hypothetical protein
MPFLRLSDTHNLICRKVKPLIYFTVLQCLASMVTLTALPSFGGEQTCICVWPRRRDKKRGKKKKKRFRPGREHDQRRERERETEKDKK